MLVRVLGSLVVESSDAAIPVGGPVPRRVLTALCVRPGESVGVDTLIDAAWGAHPPISAEATLRSHLTRLRDALGRADGESGEAGVERADGGYRISLPCDAVDAVQFTRIVQAARDQPVEEAICSLRTALELWHPPAPFADLLDTAYPAAEAARLEELHGVAVDSLVAAYLDSADPAAAGELARARLQEDPYREGLWQALVVALYRQGRQGDALAACRDARRALHEGLGIDPGPGLQAVETQVLRQDPGLLLAAWPARRPCPYKGLACYDTEDAALFVGREPLVEELVARLVDSSLLVVVGPSGVGKSSLVRAGLVPALAAGALPGSAGWRVITIQPGTDPIGALRSALRGEPDLLVVDQAGEALVDAAADRAAFARLVVAALDAGARLVLVLRADLYGRLADDPALARRTGAATVLVGPPDDEALRRIVTEPAARVGLGVDPDLADLVVTEVRGRPGALPVLSIALVRTWEQRTENVLSVNAYRAGGGIVAALQRVGEEAWARLADDAARAACRRILQRLAVQRDGIWVRRLADRRELVADGDAPAGQALQALTDARLVVARAADLEVAHEALLTGWPRLRGWLDDARAHTDVLDRLAAAATAWEREGRDPNQLYRGTRLQAALDTATSYPQDLSPLEDLFVRSSAAQIDRELVEQRERADREAGARRRARAVAAGLAAALVAAALAGGFAIHQQRQSAATALHADAGRLSALAATAGTYDRALLLAAQAVALDPSAAANSALFATLLRGDAVLGVSDVDGSVQGLVPSPGGHGFLAVTAKGTLLRVPETGGAVTTVLGPDGGGWVLAAGPGDQVALTDQLEAIALVDSRTGRRISSTPSENVQQWTMSPDGRTVVMASVDGDFSGSAVRLWRMGSTRPQASVALKARVHHVIGCGALDACVFTDDGIVTRLRYRDGRIVSSVRTADDSDPGIVATPDGQVMAISRQSGVIELRGTSDGRLISTLTSGGTAPRPLAFSPDGRNLAGSDDGTVLVWKVGEQAPPLQFAVHDGRASAAAWSTDGSTLAVGGQDATVVMLDMTGRRRLGAVLTTSLGRNVSTLWATSRGVVVGQDGGGLAVVDPHHGTVHTFRGANPHAGSESIVTARAGREDDRMLLTADWPGVTAIWDLSTRTLMARVAVPPAADGYGSDAWVSPDGRYGAVLRDDAGPQVFDMSTGKVVRRLSPLLADMNQSENLQGWTVDGTGLLVTQTGTPGSSSAVLIVDATTGSVRMRITIPGALVQEVTADPTGRYLAAAVDDGTIRVLDAHTGAPVAAPLPANPGELYNVSFSPDGRFLTGSGQPPRVTVWDTAQFQPVGSPLPIDLNVPDARARFGPDGRLFVASGTTVRAFPIDPQQWLRLACRRAGRTLTPQEWSELLPDRDYAPACR